jgi:uncharacterized protein (DUF4415 family)
MIYGCTRIVVPAPARASEIGKPEVEVKIRLDAKTVEHLRRCGPGWQTRVNAVLSDLVARREI